MLLFGGRRSYESRRDKKINTPRPHPERPQKGWHNTRLDHHHMGRGGRESKLRKDVKRIFISIKRTAGR